MPYTGIWEVSTAATAEPLTVEELRDHLREPSTEQDTLIDSISKAVRIHLERAAGRQFMKATWELHLDEFPSDDSPIRVPLPPLQSATIAYVDTAGDSQTLSTSVYTVDTDSAPGRIYLAYGQTWPSTRDQRKAVTVTFVAGYSSSATVATQRAAVPEDVKHAIRMGTERYYDLGMAPKELPHEMAHLTTGFRVWEFE